MAENQATEALEKLNQGIQKSRQMIQLQIMELAQEYFGDSIEALKQQVKESRATLRDLPKQIPGGEEEPFQMLFQELMENYTTIEESLNEAEDRVADLDTEQLRKQGELNATDAAKREARERGIDLTEVEGTGSGGRITVDDVRNATEEVEHGAVEVEENEEVLKASDAAKRRAEELGIDLTEVEGTGPGGLISVKDVASLAEKTKDYAAGVEGVASSVEQTTQTEGIEEPEATNAARRKAEELGIDLTEVEGTGSGGLITITDVMKKA